MVAYKAPDFTERAALAQQAKQRALDRLRDKPVADPAAVAARLEARAAKQAAEAERRAAKEAARLEAKAAAKKALAEKEAASAAPVLTEEERKAARDARYAARKNRKK